MSRGFWISVRFLALYGLLLAAVALSPLAGPMGRLVAGTAARVLTACTGRPVVSSVVDGAIGLGIATDGGHRFEWAPVDALGHVFNVPLFVAIVVAVAATRSGKRLSLLALGLCAIILLGLVGLDGAVVGFEAWDRWPANVRPHPNAWYQVLGTLAVLHATGGMFVAPTFLGALCAAVLVRPSVRAREAQPRRNDSCPCGSGLKFKRCCGRP